MDKNSLRKLISDKLGISSSKKEFAFDAFLKKISNSLDADEALRVPGIGYFQLKNEPLVKEERKVSRGGKKLTKRTVFFSPDDVSDQEESSLFLSFDIDVPQKDITEFDESIFSIGIQKPIAPIFEEDESAASLQRSLEARIDDIIHSSEKLVEFDLFDNYVSHVDEDNEEGPSADIEDIKEEDIPIMAFEEELKPDTLTIPEPEIEDFEDDIQEEKEEFPSEEESTEENVIDTSDSNPFDELDNLNLDQELSEDDNEIKEDTADEQQMSDDEIKNLFKKDKKTEEPAKMKPQPPSFEDIFENDDDILESVLPSSEAEILSKQIDLEDEEEESIEWDWGDELKAEFQEVPEEEAAESEEDSEEKDEIEETEDDINLADELEDELNGNELDDEDLEDIEINETAEESPDEEDIEEDNEQAMAKGVSHTIDDQYNEENADITSEEVNKEEPEPEPEEKKGKKKLSFKKYDWKSQNFSKGFWILLGVFAVFNLFGITYLLFWGNEETPVNDIIDQHDSAAVNLVVPEGEIAKVDTSKIAETEPNEIAAVENPPAEEKGLYRKVVNETRATSRVYFDGNKYMIQVSSFKSKNRAESDAFRLQGLGYDAFIVEANLPQLGGIWYRVRVGYFKTEKEAVDFLTKNKL